MSTIVNLVLSVIYDLRIFMIFFLLLVFMFSLVIGSLGVGNLYLKGDQKVGGGGKGKKKKKKVVDLD